VVISLKSGDRHMQSSQVQTAVLSQRAENCPAARPPTFTRLVGLFASILGVRALREDDIVERYAGWGWNDAVERQIVDDIATLRSSRL
jgi:hypothetical protein